MKPREKKCNGCPGILFAHELHNGRCPDCQSAYQKAIYDNTHRGKLLCYWAKQRARRKSLPYDLDQHRDDICRRIDAGVCELSGMAFEAGSVLNFYSPSLDRRNPALGYTHDNVRVILYGWNVALGTWGEEVLQRAILSWQENG